MSKRRAPKGLAAELVQSIAEGASDESWALSQMLGALVVELRGIGALSDEAVERLNDRLNDVIRQLQKASPGPRDEAARVLLPVIVALAGDRT